MSKVEDAGEEGSGGGAARALNRRSGARIVASSRRIAASDIYYSINRARRQLELAIIKRPVTVIITNQMGSPGVLGARG